jgi:hypothetical protein
MNKLLMLIVVVLFALASMSGPTMAAGVGSGRFWTIDNQELCLEPASIIEKAPTFKPCSKKINGHATFCQHIVAIMPLLVEDIFGQRSAVFVQRDTDVVPIPGTDRRFQPPQAG